MIFIGIDPGLDGAVGCRCSPSDSGPDALLRIQCGACGRLYITVEAELALCGGVGDSGGDNCRRGRIGSILPALCAGRLLVTGDAAALP